MLCLLLKHPRVRKCTGAVATVPILRWKTRKYGRTTAERVMSIKRDWLICGAQQSGKTRWVSRMYAEAAAIWKGRQTVRIDAYAPIGTWVDLPHVEKFYVAQNGLKCPLWRSLKSWEKQQVLIAWFEATHPVLLLDDAHMLAGRKADLITRLIRASGRVVATATSEGRIPVSVRLAIQQREPERLDLRSEAPADLTTALVWLLCLIALGAGAWQVAAAIGGLRLLAHGSRASKQGA
jgi:hypothetical protein